MSLVELLRNDGSGLAVVDARVKPAPGSFTPIAVMAHHTAGSRMDVRGLQRGYGFPGPLCNIGIDRDGTRVVVTDGRANDSGNGSSFVLKDLRAGRPVTRDAAARGLRDDVNGNAYFYDIEVVNDGRGQPYPAIQLESLAVTAAAICRAHRWSEQRVIHHRQWTRRKVDMSWRGDLTGMVARALTGEQDDEMQLKRGDSGRAVRAFQLALIAEAKASGRAGGNPLPDYGADSDFGEETENAVKAYQRAAQLPATGRVDGVTAALLVRYIPAA